MIALTAALTTGTVGAATTLPPGGTFTDDDNNTHEPNIEAIKAAGITTGCAPTLYCPDDPVTRGQMAAFFNRALHLPKATSPSGFTDTAGTFKDDIERLKAAAITTGCTPTLYCTNRPVTRAEMATFLTRALHLTPITPPPRGMCEIFPTDNVWNTRADGLPVHARSADYVATIGGSKTVHADFGSGEWPPGSGSPIGIPVLEVGSSQPNVPVHWTAYGSESDPGPYPIPLSAPIEGGPAATGDRHVIVVDTGECTLHELFDAHPTATGWNAASGAVYDLRSNAMRPNGWTTADAAGLPILPGLVRYDEVRSGVIDHAIRFTAPVTARRHVWPARHDAGSTSSTAAPPMGQRFRLKKNVDISGYSRDARIILTAMRDYGIILADNGSSWYISGSPDERWNNDVLHELGAISGSAFEAVDSSGLIADPNSARALAP
ncbi:MAG: S-layer homology domain-containing protein [Acidimicrobiales bacterium]